MAEVNRIRAALFAKDLNRVAEFYSEALGMERGKWDECHAVLERSGFELIIHQVPAHIASGIQVQQPPIRREGGTVRLDYPVESLERSRVLANSFGGEIDTVPPPWAERDVNFFLGTDPEGNVFGVSQQAS